MRLLEILQDIEYEILQGEIDIEIKGFTNDSRKVIEKGVFVCIKGAMSDGHTYAQAVAQAGVSAVVVEDEITLPKGVTVIKVKDSRYALALMSAAYYGYPAKKLRIIGITGTKGKTTTAYIIRNILKNAGYKVGLIGTIEAIIGEKHIPAKNTSPESIVIQEYFKEMVEIGCEYVVMEVSSQGLKYHRTAGIPFEVGIFTNLAVDHIGENEHPDFEDYKYCKSLLFKQCKLGIGNIDDPYFKDMFKHATCKIQTIGLHEDAELRAKDIELTREQGSLGVSYRTEGLISLEAKVKVPGNFSVYNSLMAIAVCVYLGIEKNKIEQALQSAKAKGRVELIEVSDEYTLMIDYAHNAMSLGSLLKTLREYHPKRLVCMFGCGGNRSKTRRYEMGEIAGNLADFTIITSDNPRMEEPQAIIEDIKIGMKKTGGEYTEIADRKEAMKYAIVNGKPGDVIVFAGKGHEDYQEICGVKYDMDERVIIQEILDEIGQAKGKV